MASADAVLNLFEQRHGILLKKSFYNDWYQSESHSSSAPPQLETLYNGIFKHFLNSDMAACTEPFLQAKGIQTKMVLQLQHTVDTSSSLFYLTDSLDKNGPISRGNLKWIMTDGDRDIIVFELIKIPSMNLKTPFGSKVQITSGLYASGILLVKPEGFQLLGGQVPELYGDTMENELLRRYRKQLQIQSGTAHEQTTRQTPIQNPTYQNDSRLTTTSNRFNGNISSGPTPHATFNGRPQQSNPSAGAIGTTSIDGFDDEFDYWPSDDFDDLEVFEKQATATVVPVSTATSTNNIHPTQDNDGPNHSMARNNTFSQRPTLPTDHSYSSTVATSTDTPKRRPLSLSTKSKHNVTAKLPTSNPTPAVRPSSPTYIDLDNTPSPPLRPLSDPQQMKGLDLDDMMFDDFQWVGDTPQEQDNEKIMDETNASKTLSISELRTLLKSVDDNSFRGNFDKVSVQVDGFLLLRMKPLAKDGLYLMAELLENRNNEKRILVNFIYLGINSLFEGYTLDGLTEIKKKDGIGAVKEKVFYPLKSRLQKTKAVLEIDLTLTEMDDSKSVVRKCTKFTPMSS